MPPSPPTTHLSSSEAVRVLVEAHHPEGPGEAAFRGIVANVSAAPDLLLGEWIDGKLVGVIAYVPDFKVKPTGWDRVKGWWMNRRYRLNEEWRTYSELARAQDFPAPTLHILALGVLPEARKKGVARHLIERVCADDRWPIKWVQAETWSSRNASIYQKLGFEFFNCSRRDDVVAYTMVKPR